jgi:hypothetical protein
MASSDGPAASFAASVTVLEASANIVPDDFVLVLGVDPFGFDLSSAMRTGFGTRGVVGLVDLGGWLAVSFVAVIFSRLAARFLGIGFGIAFRKGSRLSLLASLEFLDSSAKPGQFGFQLAAPRAG